MELFSLRGRVAVVTGALGLLGKQHCYALAHAGAHVVVTDLHHAACVEFAQTLSDDAGNGATGIGADITDRASVESLAKLTHQELGRIDVLVNNAAINEMVEKSPDGINSLRFENLPLDRWERSLQVNVTGTFLCCQVIGSLMSGRQTGSIINIASTYGMVAPDQSLYRRPDGTQEFYKSPAYVTTKGAVLALTRYLAAYWGETGVRVNALSPGGVQNNQHEYFIENYARRTPLRRMAAPADYRGAIVFLASDASAYMTGANLVVDGGWTIW